MISNSEPMGIYIHIPFCLHKCDYCDFYSLPWADKDILEKYTHSVINELHLRQLESNRPFASIYLGGGTPSLLSPGQIERILEAIYKYYRPYEKPEISMEVNPATVNLQDMRDLRRVGVNRLSIGVQSFSDIELNILGRIHSGHEASLILSNVRKAGFDNFNIDLIYGLPGQTIRAWQANLNQAVDFDPEHISAYLLQLEPTTPMARKINEGTLSLLDDELESDLYYFTLEFLQEKDYGHYEISNFATVDRQCRHNMLYWRGCNYLGIGAGAVSFDGIQRTLNQPPLEKYIEDLLTSRPPARKILESMDSRQKVVDAIIMGLRLTDGINIEEFKQRFEIDILKEYGKTISNCQMQGLLERVKDSIYLTKKAYFLSNQVFSQFIS